MELTVSVSTRSLVRSSQKRLLFVPFDSLIVPHFGLAVKAFSKLFSKFFELRLLALLGTFLVYYFRDNLSIDKMHKVCGEFLVDLPIDRILAAATHSGQPKGKEVFSHFLIFGEQIEEGFFRVEATKESVRIAAGVAV